MEDTFEEALPISLFVGAELGIIFPKINAIGQRLSAQLNFQTMLCNWFGDEDDIFTVSINIDVSSVYDNQKCLFQAEHDALNQLIEFSDDVCFCHKKEAHHLNVLVAITENELNFLKKNRRVLKKYLETKVVKVMNLLANNLGLSEIPLA